MTSHKPWVCHPCNYEFDSEWELNGHLFWTHMVCPPEAMDDVPTWMAPRWGARWGGGGDKQPSHFINQWTRYDIELMKPVGIKLD